MNSTFVAYKPGQYAARSDHPDAERLHHGNFASGDEATAANEAVGLVDMSVSTSAPSTTACPATLLSATSSS